MADNFNMDAYSPQQIAERVDNIGVTKARLPLLSMAMLGMLAGAFIGLGALYYTLVVSDASLSFAVARVLGAVCFSLGLLLVVVAGAELFTGNNLLAMAWADGKVSTAEVLRNWAVVCAANFVGAAGLALLVFLSGHAGMNGGALTSSPALYLYGSAPILGAASSALAKRPRVRTERPMLAPVAMRSIQATE